ncbi:hydroxymethylglutaryl-CoA synthase 1-like protein, partial [Leptotrombidium deliense]
MDMYVPSFFVAQSDLEKYDGVSTGKYTIGLQQRSMAIPSDAEDIHSMCLTVVHSLIEKFEICEKNVGFLMVGTETLIDEMKSVKSVLMQLFAEHGNTDIQGSDTRNACYGGTAALFHAVDWVESSNWDQRLAIVVIADIALYDKGPARPTCGAGAIALLIGPNAPLVIEGGLRATHMIHAYDFYKPQLHMEYPFVDGKISITCYLEAVDQCYKLFKEKYTKKHSLSQFDLAHFDGLLFHSPYCKIVSKAVARLFLNDYLENPTCHSDLNNDSEKSKLNLDKKFNDKEVENYFLKISKQTYKSKSEASLDLITDIGNMYTASLYCCLISYILSKSPDQLKNTRILMYGHGG